MPHVGKYPVNYKNAKELWDKHNTGQGFGSLYGGNQISNVSKSLNNKTIDEERASKLF